MAADIDWHACAKAAYGHEFRRAGMAETHPWEWASLVVGGLWMDRCRAVVVALEAQGFVVVRRDDLSDLIDS